MKDNRLIAALVVLLFLAGVSACALSLSFAFTSRDLRRTQALALVANSRLNFAQALLNDTIEYSKRNRDIDPLLVSLNFKSNSINPAAVATPRR